MDYSTNFNSRNDFKLFLKILIIVSIIYACFMCTACGTTQRGCGYSSKSYNAGSKYRNHPSTSRYKAKSTKRNAKIFAKKHYNKPVKYKNQGSLYHGAVKSQTRGWLVETFKREGIRK